MQDYINTLIKYWYIFLPLITAIIIVIWILVRKGYLHEMNLFGLKFEFKRALSDETKGLDKSLKSSPSLRDYEISFTDMALENISNLRITQETVIRLVESEFTHHVNYFKWDLLDYPLPVQAGYIIVLDKTGGKVNFRGIKRADLNELELASLNDLLAIYRRLSRFEYRLNKDHILRLESVEAIVDQHKEVIRRLIRHYEIFKHISLPEKEKFPTLFLKYLSGSSELDKKTKDSIQKFSTNTKGFGHNVVASISALYDIDELIANQENGLMSQAEVDKETVLCLERSLQYIHKMINACLE